MKLALQCHKTSSQINRDVNIMVFQNPHMLSKVFYTNWLWLLHYIVNCSSKGQMDVDALHHSINSFDAWRERNEKYLSFYQFKFIAFVLKRDERKSQGTLN